MVPALRWTIKRKLLVLGIIPSCPCSVSSPSGLTGKALREEAAHLGLANFRRPHIEHDLGTSATYSARLPPLGPARPGG